MVAKILAVNPQQRSRRVWAKLRKWVAEQVRKGEAVTGVLPDAPAVRAALFLRTKLRREADGAKFVEMKLARRFGSDKAR